MKKIITLLSALSLMRVIAMADDGTVTQTQEKLGPVYKSTFTWTSNAGTNYVQGTGTVAIRGELLRVVFDPVTSARPTSAYTITLLDASGVDLLAGQGASLATGTVTTIRPGIVMAVGAVSNIAPFAINDLLTVTVTNSGLGKSGKLIIYTR